MIYKSTYTIIFLKLLKRHFDMKKKFNLQYHNYNPIKSHM